MTQRQGQALSVVNPRLDAEALTGQLRVRGRREEGRVSSTDSEAPSSSTREAASVGP